MYRETAAWLEIGQVLSDEKIKKLLDTDQKNEVYEKALEFISFKPRTIHETRIKLQKSGYDEELINSTLAELSENGLLDDEIYANLWVEERSSFKPRSRRMISYELRRKGISDELIQSAVEEIDDYINIRKVEIKKPNANK